MSNAQMAHPPAPWQDVPWDRWENWRWQIANRVTTVEQLSQVINLTDEEKEVIARSLNPLRVLAAGP